MMRRHYGTTILGRPVVTLPTPHPEIRYVQFSDEERIVYRIVSLSLFHSCVTFQVVQAG